MLLRKRTRSDENVTEITPFAQPCFEFSDEEMSILCDQEECADGFCEQDGCTCQVFCSCATSDDCPGGAYKSSMLSGISRYARPPSHPKFDHLAS